MIPKFRAWDNDEKIMHNHINIVVDENGSLEAVILKYEFNGYDFCELEVTEQDNLYIYYEDTFPYIIMQSTGLKDKNGVEIYESDIVVNHVGDEWVITYFRGAFRYYPIESFSEEEERWFETDNIGNFGTDAFEVIGNIYENPERLEAHT